MYSLSLSPSLPSSLLLLLPSLYLFLSPSPPPLPLPLPLPLPPSHSLSLCPCSTSSMSCWLVQRLTMLQCTLLPYKKERVLSKSLHIRNVV